MTRPLVDGGGKPSIAGILPRLRPLRDAFASDPGISTTFSLQAPYVLVGPVQEPD